jgi:ribonuclease Z
MIDVALIGTGGMMPLPGRWLSALLLRISGDLILFDCGEGTQIAMRQTGWGFRRLGMICISHTHADHIAGLPGLLHAVANAGRTEPLDLFGPVGIGSAVAGLRVIAPYLPYDVRVRELEGGEAAVMSRGATLRVTSGAHSLPVLAYRIDLPRGRRFLTERATLLGVPLDLWRRLQAGETVSWPGGNVSPDDVLGPHRSGLAVGYVTDTRPTSEIARLVAGVDLLVCEGTYGSDEEQAKAEARGHMTFRDAATLARDAGVGRLWLTHFSPALERPEAFAEIASATFPRTTVGQDGLTTSLTFEDD